MTEESTPTKDPSICPCGNNFWQCENPACVQEMIDAEDAAYCPHGYLAGCPTCTGMIKGKL